MMKSPSIEVRKLAPALGAEIFGVDLAGAPDDRQWQAIRDALIEHQVIFFRDQKLTPEQHKDFGRRFGSLHIHPAPPNGVVAGHPEMMVISADEKSKYVAGEKWHSDVSCDAEPPMGSILHVSEIPANGGGDTLFASMYAAYEALSEPMQRFLGGLTAVHDGDRNYRGRYVDKDTKSQFPRAEHPVVRTHPVSGRQGLFVNRIFTTRIVQLKTAESDGLLEMLFQHIETPEFQCRFKWQPDSVAFWDNRCTQHRAVWDYYPLRRYGVRVTINGDKPFYRPPA